jgi:predicted TIM-barrel fold metal-dependent hydrolase
MFARRLFLTSALAVAGLATAGCQTTAPVGRTALYDTHSHFFSNDAERYPIDTTGAHEGADVLRNRIMTNPSTPENILKLWSQNNVAGGVGVQYNSAYKTDNSYLLDSSDAHRDLISAVIILDARKPETPAKLRDLVEKRGVTGLRLTGYPDKAGNYPWLDSDAAQATWAEADRLGLSVVLMYLPTEPSPAALAHIAGLAERYHNVKIVLDHIGWPALTGAQDYGLTPGHAALKSFPNVYFKLTTINLDNLEKAGLDSSDFLRHVVDVYGADRIMWGSDYGNTPGTFSDMVTRAERATAKLKPVERRKVLHDTGHRLFARRERR